MISTMKQKRKQISDLAMDLEVINPIESKTFLGGDWYNGWDSWYYDDGGITFTYGGDGGGYYDPFGGNGDYTDGSSWGNQGGDSGGGGGGAYYGPGNLPSTVEQQLGSMGACVSYAMSFMSGVLGHQITGPMMAVHNAGVLNLNISTTISTGLTPAQATTAITSYFNTNTVTTTAQVNAALDAGHGVLGNYNGHEVAIVNHNGTNYTVADSNTGTYHDIQQSQIDFNNGVYEILSVKP
jgi:hypothetical protein